MNRKPDIKFGIPFSTWNVASMLRKGEGGIRDFEKMWC